MADELNSQLKTFDKTNMLRTWPLNDNVRYATTKSGDNHCYKFDNANFANQHWVHLPKNWLLSDFPLSSHRLTAPRTPSVLCLCRY